MVAFDPAQRPSSVNRLPRSVAAVGFAHGDALCGAAVDRYRALLERLVG